MIILSTLLSRSRDYYARAGKEGKDRRVEARARGGAEEGKYELPSLFGLKGIDYISISSEIHKSSGMKSEMKALLLRVRELTKAKGAKARLAATLDVHQSQISDWLAGNYALSGEVALFGCSNGSSNRILNKRRNRGGASNTADGGRPGNQSNRMKRSTESAKGSRAKGPKTQGETASRSIRNASVKTATAQEAERECWTELSREVKKAIALIFSLRDRVSLTCALFDDPLQESISDGFQDLTWETASALLESFDKARATCETDARTAGKGGAVA